MDNARSSAGERIRIIWAIAAKDIADAIKNKTVITIVLGMATLMLSAQAWDLYAFEIQGYPVDLALAEDGEKAYFVLLLSPPDEHEALYDQIFLPAVEAMAAL